MTALRVTELHQTFNAGTINEVRALRGMTFELGESEFVTVIGSNGAGKSTFFNAIAGAVVPTQGTIEIGGQNVTSWPEHRRAGYVGRVFQNPLHGTAASMTIGENLTLSMMRGKRLSFKRALSHSRRRQLEKHLEPIGLGLEGRLNDSVALLSGGQRQALSLVMASFSEPKVLLLDEHTSALDPETARQIIDMTDNIVGERRLATLMITHNMQQALDHGTRTMMLHKGQVVLDLSAEERRGMSVQDLIAKFAEVRHEELTDDVLLLDDN